MDETQLKQIVNSEFRTSLGANGGQISNERAKAWDYYLSKPLGNEIEGQSQVVSSDVAEVVDGIMPSLLRMFTSADNLCSFDAVGPEDSAASAQQSAYVNHVFFKKNPAFLTLFYWFFDALVQKNGITMAWWDESEKVTYENYSGLNELEVSELLDDDELEPIERSEEEGESPDGPTILHSISFKRISKKGRVKIECVPPEEYRISGDCRSLDPSEARMVGRERLVKRSDLIDMGYDRAVVDALPADTDDAQNSPEGIARRDKDDETFNQSHEKSQEEIMVRLAHIKVDFDDDGRSELRYVVIAGNEVMENEPVDRQPFHVLCPQPLPHKHFGLSSAEKVMDIQQKTTTLERQILDNLYHTNNPGHAVWEEGMGDDTLDDLLTTQVGRVARFARPVGESYAPLTVPFTAAASFPMIEYYEKRKRDRTGVGSDSEGLAPDQLKNIQQSVMSQSTDISKMKVEAVARIFAETGIRSLFLHIHELLLKHQNKMEVFRLRNEWIPINPGTWRTREDLTVNIGLGHASREQNLMHLSAIKDFQAQIMGGGGAGLLITPANIYNTAAEYTKNAGMKDPTMFFTDPGDAEFPTPGEGEQDGQMQLIQRQQELEGQKQQLDAQKQQLAAERHQFDQQAQIGKAQNDMQKFMQEMEIRNQEREDKMTIAMEKISNELTKMELDSGVDVPGAAV